MKDELSSRGQNLHRALAQGCTQWAPVVPAKGDPKNTLILGRAARRDTLLPLQDRSEDCTTEEQTKKA